MKQTVFKILMYSLIGALICGVVNIPLQWVYDESHPGLREILFNSLSVIWTSFPICIVLGVLHAFLEYENTIGKLRMENRALKNFFHNQTGKVFKPPYDAVIDLDYNRYLEESTHFVLNFEEQTVLKNDYYKYLDKESTTSSN